MRPHYHSASGEKDQPISRRGGRNAERKNTFPENNINTIQSNTMSSNNDNTLRSSSLLATARQLKQRLLDAEEALTKKGLLKMTPPGFALDTIFAPILWANVRE